MNFYEVAGFFSVLKDHRLHATQGIFLDLGLFHDLGLSPTLRRLFGVKATAVAPGPPRPGEAQPGDAAGRTAQPGTTRTARAASESRAGGEPGSDRADNGNCISFFAPDKPRHFLFLRLTLVSAKKEKTKCNERARAHLIYVGVPTGCARPVSGWRFPWCLSLIVGYGKSHSSIAVDLLTNFFWFFRNINAKVPLPSPPPPGSTRMGSPSPVFGAVPLRDCAGGFVGLGRAAALSGPDHDREAGLGGCVRLVFAS